MIEQGREFSYDAIIFEAQRKAAELKPLLPSLPTTDELEPIIGKIWARDRQLIDAIRRHLDEWGTGHGHGFEHLEWVAANGSYVAQLECNDREIRGEDREEIIQRTERLGLTHDLQRWRGFQQDHAVEGRLAAIQMLHDLGIKDEMLPSLILVHDEMNTEPRNNPLIDIPLFADFAVDHLNWGLQWEESIWDRDAKLGVSPSEAIHDYAFMERLLLSPNLQQTFWGREVAIPYVEYGLAIAKHIEALFS